MRILLFAETALPSFADNAEHLWRKSMNWALDRGFAALLMGGFGFSKGERMIGGTGCLLHTIKVMQGKAAGTDGKGFTDGFGDVDFCQHDGIAELPPQRKI